MAHISSTVITPSNPKTEIQSPADFSPLLLLPLVTAVAYHYSKKQMRKSKRKMVWQLMKMKLKSMFSGSDKKKSLLFKIFLIAILIGLAFGIIFSFTAGLFAFVLSLVAAVVVLFVKADRG
jgi:fatty acid desaturase